MWSIWTNRLPCTVIKIWFFILQTFCGYDVDLLGSRDVIESLKLAICGYRWSFKTVTLSHIVVKQLAEHSPIENALMVKCFNPYFCVLGGKIGGYSVFNLVHIEPLPKYIVWALNRHNDWSTGLVTAVLGPSHWKCIMGWKLGQNTGRDYRILTP